MKQPDPRNQDILVRVAEATSAQRLFGGKDVADVVGKLFEGTSLAQVFDGVVESVQASGVLGDFGVLPGHYPYITSVRPGALSFADGKEPKVYAVGHGFAQVSAERVSVVVSSCEDASTVDLAAARQALDAAEKQLLEVAS